MLNTNAPLALNDTYGSRRQVPENIQDSDRYGVANCTQPQPVFCSFARPTHTAR